MGLQLIRRTLDGIIRTAAGHEPDSSRVRHFGPVAVRKRWLNDEIRPLLHAHASARTLRARVFGLRRRFALSVAHFVPDPERAGYRRRLRVRVHRCCAS